MNFDLVSDEIFQAYSDDRQTDGQDNDSGWTLSILEPLLSKQL